MRPWFHARGAVRAVGEHQQVAVRRGRPRRGSRPTRPGSRPGAGAPETPQAASYRSSTGSSAPAAATSRRTSASPWASRPGEHLHARRRQPGVHRQAEAEGPGAVAEQPAAGHVRGEPVDGAGQQPGQAAPRRSRSPTGRPAGRRVGAALAPGAAPTTASADQERPARARPGRWCGSSGTTSAFQMPPMPRRGQRRRQAALAVQGEHRGPAPGGRAGVQQPGHEPRRVAADGAQRPASGRRGRTSRGERQPVTRRVDRGDQPGRGAQAAERHQHPGDGRHPSGTTGAAAGEDQPGHARRTRPAPSSARSPAARR